RPALEYLITGRRDPAATEVGTRAENRRKQCASGGQRRLPIWYSPKPGSAGDDPDGRPAPGKELEFTMKRIAATGKDRRWGTALYLVARDFESPAGLELGACAGISAIYLSSAPQMKSLITVEGSAPLAGLAAESLQPFSHARVVNALFDDAIDAELPGVKLDLAY